MKKIIFVLAVCGASLFFLNVQKANSSSGLCFLCGSGSSCQQCVSNSGRDTSADRKICEQRGCKITGYSSCSTAANISTCR